MSGPIVQVPVVGSSAGSHRTCGLGQSSGFSQLTWLPERIPLDKCRPLVASQGPADAIDNYKRLG